jgi:quercetin dioxygenase-like cupin family protein
MTPVPVVASGDSGEQLWFGGGLVTFKITSKQSGGAFAVIEDVMPRGKTTPLHLHETFDETIYVVEGELLVHIDGIDHTVGAGAVAAITRGTPHALLVISETARILGFVTPGDTFEKFFREGGETPAAGQTEPPPLDIERVRAAGERTGAMKVLGPPPFNMKVSA